MSLLLLFVNFIPNFDFFLLFHNMELDNTRAEQQEMDLTTNVAEKTYHNKRGDMYKTNKNKLIMIILLLYYY